jgi:hypothetical protein
MVVSSGVPLWHHPKSKRSVEFGFYNGRRPHEVGRACARRTSSLLGIDHAKGVEHGPSAASGVSGNMRLIYRHVEATAYDVRVGSRATALHQLRQRLLPGTLMVEATRTLSTSKIAVLNRGHAQAAVRRTCCHPLARMLYALCGARPGYPYASSRPGRAVCEASSR